MSSNCNLNGVNADIISNDTGSSRELDCDISTETVPKQYYDSPQHNLVDTRVDSEISQAEIKDDSYQGESTIQEKTVIQKTVTTELKEVRRKSTNDQHSSHSSTDVILRRENSVTETRSPAILSNSPFSLDLTTTLPQVAPVPPPAESKYKLAFQCLYMQLPERIKDPNVIAGHLYSKFILSDAEHESLKVVFDNKGKIPHCQQLLDIIKGKSDKQIEEFLELLEQDDFNQKPIADWIRHTAEKCEQDEARRRQNVHCIVPRNPKKRSRRASDSDDETSENKHQKLDLDLILKTVPCPSVLSADNRLLVKRQGHLLFSITFKEGIDDITAYLKQSLYQLKSELQADIGIPCSCVTEDLRTEKTKACASMVSVGFVSGERDAFELLESKLIDFESHVIQQKATLVSVTEGCIRIKLRFDSVEKLDSLCDDLNSGDFLCRITKWLHEQGYTGSDDRPVFMLISDSNDVEVIRKTLVAGEDRPKARRSKHIKTLMESIESSTKNPKHDIDLILRTMPKSTSNADKLSGGIKGTAIGRKGPLLMSVKYLRGSDDLTGYVKHSIYKMKSEVSKSLNMPCACITEDLRTRTDETDSTLVSVGFEAGEKEAYNILESNLADFEEYVFKKTAAVVSVIEGCVKIRIKLLKKNYVLGLYNAIVSGKLVHDITSWLVGKGYKGSKARPVLMLTVDEKQIVKIIEENIEENSGRDIYEESRNCIISSYYGSDEHPQLIINHGMPEWFVQVQSNCALMPQEICCI